VWLVRDAVTFAWIAVAAIAILLLLAWSRLRGQRGSDLGTVSEKWLAEHRIGRWGPPQ
jgi:hypothetical protein